MSNFPELIEDISELSDLFIENGEDTKVRAAWHRPDGNVEILVNTKRFGWDYTQTTVYLITGDGRPPQPIAYVKTADRSTDAVLKARRKKWAESALENNYRVELVELATLALSQLDRPALSQWPVKGSTVRFEAFGASRLGIVVSVARTGTARVLYTTPSSGGVCYGRNLKPRDFTVVEL